MSEKVTTRCPFHGRECIREDCTFCLNGSKDVHNCCQMQQWLDKYEHRQSTFNKRLNELIDDAGGCE